MYQRVSDDRANGRSVAEQEAENRAVVKRHGWELVRVFTDNSIGASRYSKGQRQEWEQLVAMLERGEADVVVTWEASRSTRDLRAYVELRTVCRKHNVLWCYSGKLYDFSRTDDSFQTGLDILLAEREVDQTRERVMRSMRANAVSGRPHGKLTYGYKREYDRHSGALIRQVVDEGQAEVIREAARRILAGESYNAIAKDFNRRGIDAPRSSTWVPTQLKRILTNPAYIAKRVHQGEVIGTADWPPILDDSTFRQLSAKLCDPRRKFTNENAVKYLLSGIVVCGVCGSETKCRSQRNGYKAYVCKNFCSSRKMAWVDSLIERLIVERLSQPDALVLFDELDTDTTPILDAIQEKRTRLEDFWDAGAKGEISPAALGRIEGTLQGEISALESQIRRYDVPSVVYDLAHKPLQVWQGLTLEQKREVVRCLVVIRILPGHPGRKQFDPATVQIEWRGSGAARIAAQESA